MKKYLLLFFLLLALEAAFGQSKPAQNTNVKPSGQKEIDAAMKEAQKALDALSPEDKKAMEEMGVKIPDMNSIQNNVSGISDAQLQQAYVDENRIVPEKDQTRINTISKTPVTASSIGSYINKVNNETIALLTPASRTLGEKIYTQLKTDGYNAADIGNSAAGLWIAGHIQPALYILGKVCTEDITNTDNLNNYAAVLSMCGAEQKAIPVLNYLNTKFPGNSTILNNLGQAWFGLGEIAEAEKYFDSTIRIYAYHPQACLSKSMIEESKGNKTEAVNLVKNSIQHSYSKEKEDRLRKLGYKLTSKDVTLPPKTKTDPLNLGGSNHPGFPKSVEECIAMEPEWENFRQQLKNKSAALGNQLKDALKVAADLQEKRNNENINMVKASVNAGSPQGFLTLVPMYADQAYLKQKEVTDIYERKLKEWSIKTSDFFKGPGLQLIREYETEIEKLQNEDSEQTGEGLPNEDFCPRYKEVSDKYLRAYNSATERLFDEYLEFLKGYLNELTYWQMYSEWPEKFEANKLEAQITWLGALSGESTVDFISITKYKCAKPVEGNPGILAEFDDVACHYHSELNLIVFKMKSDCSRMTTKLDIKFLKLNLKQDLDKETFGDQFMNCTVEVKAKIGGDKMDIGPIAVGAKAEAGIGLEIDRSGVKDVYLIAGVKAQAGVIDTKIGTGAGIEGRIGIISGHSTITGTGIFKNLK